MKFWQDNANRFWIFAWILSPDLPQLLHAGIDLQLETQIENSFTHWPPTNCFGILKILVSLSSVPLGTSVDAQASACPSWMSKQHCNLRRRTRWTKLVPNKHFYERPLKDGRKLENFISTETSEFRSKRIRTSLLCSTFARKLSTKVRFSNDKNLDKIVQRKRPPLSMRHSRYVLGFFGSRFLEAPPSLKLFRWEEASTN